MLERLTRIVVTLAAVLALVAPVRAAVVINEVMYHPASGDDADEFIEIYNSGPGAADVSGWCFDGITYCFPGSTSIADGGYFVLALDSAQFNSTYGGLADDQYLAVPQTSLADGGERLALLDDMQVLVDEVIYSDKPPWPVTPDGQGPSLEVVDPDQDNATPRNWHASAAALGTPGAINSVDAAGLPPWFDSVQHTADPQPAVPIVVNATILDATSAQLTYQIDFGICSVTDTTVCSIDGDCPVSETCVGGEVDLAMNQVGNDYDATIPAQPAGTLVRYRISVSGATGTMQHPRDDDTVTYTGTAVIDPLLSSSLPIFQWFMAQPHIDAAKDHKNTDDTEPAVLFYDGQLYDGCQARYRGQSARSWPKPPWKFFMPQGHEFAAPGFIEQPVDTFALQSNYSDKSYVREILAWESFRDAGVPSNIVFPVRVERNGQFFGLFNFLEASDADWVARNRLSPTAARYKASSDCRMLTTTAEVDADYEKKSRLHEDSSDLLLFLLDLNSLATDDLREFLYDNVDIPGMINYIAVQTIVHNNDHVRKNYYLYRDTDGTQRWTMHPWDLDLTMGRNFVEDSLNDTIWADDDSVSGKPLYISPSHPMFGTNERRKYNDAWNRFIDRVLLTDAAIQQMFFRRLRSLMDLLLEDGRYEARIDELKTLIATEAALDKAAWVGWGLSQDLTQATDILKTDYLAVRRDHLYVTHSVCDIPDAQSAAPIVVINEIMYNPTGGDADEFIELYNPSGEAVDISDWRLDGVALTFPSGTVIPADGYALVVKNDPQFRTTFGGGKFIAAHYDGSLNDVGESLVLRNPFGAVVSSVAYENVAPWPVLDGSQSLELKDPTQDENRVINWIASGTAPTPGAPNEGAQSIGAVPSVYVNEVLPDNQSIIQDELSMYKPWLEIYNASSSSIDLDTMYLSDQLGSPTLWSIPSGAQLCGGCWLLIWADGADRTTPPYHTNFTLSAAGGFVGLFDSGGNLIDYLNYPALPTDVSYGRFADGGSDLRLFSIVTAEAANDVPPSPLILNEYNAVSDLDFLGNLAADPYWGRIEGNGGDWFELVVTQDHLDITDWRLEIDNNSTVQTLFLTNDPLWSDMRAGTIVTVSEGLADDVGFDQQMDDWWINVQAANSGTGQYITAQDFEVANVNWQLTIKDSLDLVVFGPVGEGINPVSGVGSEDVFKLEEDPTPFITSFADYNDGTSSTFGLPNVYSGGTFTQDFTSLRAIGATGTCVLPDADGDLICDAEDNCPGMNNPLQEDADGDGIGDVCDTCPFDPANDADSDTICGDVDNCPNVANMSQDDTETVPDGVGDVCDNCASDSNPDQADDDDDGLGDACDACLGDPVNDPDMDSICDSVDNCPEDSNNDQMNMDGDSAGDACDTCPNDPLNDIDLDTICGDVDNCPTTPNTNQANGDADTVGDVCDNCPADDNTPQTDTDSDGQGDVCDADDDNDGILDDGDGSMVIGDGTCMGGNTTTCDDNCILVANPDQADADNDGQGDACVADNDNDGILDDGDGSTIEGDARCFGGNSVSCDDNCPLFSNPAQTDTDSDGYGDDCDCAFDNASVSTMPGTANESLRMDKVAGATLYYGHARQGHVSNVYRGTFSVGAWVYDEVCIDAENPGSETIDASEPPLNTGYYYLASGSNICGEGAAGVSTAGIEIHPMTVCTTGTADFDTDAVNDKEDNCSTDLNGTQDDADRDFVGDVCDNCPSDANPLQTDMDGDLDGDACDPDADGDLVTDSSDNCVGVANPVADCDNDAMTPEEQCDLDGDGLGDACDPCTDTDGDGLANPGLGSVCPEDPFPDDAENDADADGVSASLDNCPLDFNDDQLDSDDDGLGDACDTCPFDPDNDIDQDGVCAGDCGLVEITLLDLAESVETVLVEFGTSMKYLDNIADPALGLTWIVDTFDDSAWAAGSYGVGYEAATGAENLIQTSVPVGTASIYTRAVFNIADVGQVNDLWFSADYDDGVIAWINGVEVYRSAEMPVGAPDWDTEPTTHESSNGPNPDYGPPIQLAASALAALQNGPNVLAVGVWNWVPAVPPSDDLVVVPKLAMNRQPTMTYRVNSSDPLLGLTWKDEFFDDSAWSTGNFGIGYDQFSEAANLLTTVVPFPAQSIYTRAEFEVLDASALDIVLFGADYDDGVIAWINGTEIWRSPEMPAGTPLWDTTPILHESSNAAEPVFNPVNVSTEAVPAVHSGTNVLAVGVWNQRPDSSDLVLWPSLSINGRNADNCPTVYNPSPQADTDDDGVGDVCDNCPGDYNPTQIDSDGDGDGDACDP